MIAALDHYNITLFIYIQSLPQNPVQSTYSTLNKPKRNNFMTSLYMFTSKSNILPPIERNTKIFPLSVTNVEEIDFSSIEEAFRQDVPAVKLASIENILQRRVVDGGCVDDIALSSLFEDETRKGNRNTPGPTCCDTLEPIPLGERSQSERQQIIPDGEDNHPIEAFPDDDSYDDHNTYQDELPSLQHPLSSQASVISFTSTSPSCDVAATVVPATVFQFSANFADAAPNEKITFQQTIDYSTTNIEGVLSEAIITTEDDNSMHRTKFRDYQREQWEIRYRELVKVFRETGRSSVHHTDVSKKCLARWIKRQRYHYKLRQDLKPSSMTDERIEALEGVDFVWDSHSTAWEDRIIELKAFKAVHEHCNVSSSTYPVSRTFRSWVKCQRRQYRLMKEGNKSNLTRKRMSQLERLGFQFS